MGELLDRSFSAVRLRRLHGAADAKVRSLNKEPMESLFVVNVFASGGEVSNVW